MVGHIVLKHCASGWSAVHANKVSTAVYLDDCFELQLLEGLQPAVCHCALLCTVLPLEVAVKTLWILWSSVGPSLLHTQQLAGSSRVLECGSRLNLL